MPNEMSSKQWYPFSELRVVRAGLTVVNRPNTDGLGVNQIVSLMDEQLLVLPEIREIG